jgi:hypothetical protein
LSSSPPISAFRVQETPRREGGRNGTVAAKRRRLA